MRELKGNSQMRGRNGWFVPRGMYAFATRNVMTTGSKQEVVVEFNSKQAASHPPVWMWLSVEDAKAVAEELNRAIAEAELTCDCNLPFSQCDYHTAKYGPLEAEA